MSTAMFLKAECQTVNSHWPVHLCF